MVRIPLRLYVLTAVLFWIGVLLLGLNVVGIFVSLRNPDLYREELVFFKDDITLTEEQLWSSAVRRPDESTGEYVIRLNGGE
jgi:hypothetical protein